MNPEMVDKLAEEIADVCRDGGTCKEVQDKAAALIVDAFNLGVEHGQGFDRNGDE